MKCLAIITDDKLVQKLAVYYDNNDDIEEIKSEIIRRITDIKPTDIELITQIIKTAEEIQTVDSDMLRQSQTMKKLGRHYHKLKNRLLARIKNESDVALCETT